MNKKFRDCNCGHTKDHHSTTREPHRCLHDDCNCMDYCPMGAVREVKIDTPKISEIATKFFFEKESEQGRIVWYVIEKPILVIATCYNKDDAERITNLLNFIEKYKTLQEHEKKMLEPLLENK